LFLHSSANASNNITGKAWFFGNNQFQRDLLSLFFTVNRTSGCL
jgi:hypothetical protein